MNNMERLAMCSRTILENVQNEEELTELVEYMDHFIRENQMRWRIEKAIEASEKEQEESGELFDARTELARIRKTIRG
ncbi:MAG: hypothetical protein II979_02545 [Clostridia bacterium]|nr:hypothetical protein [Clostridia bacterium]